MRERERASKLVQTCTHVQAGGEGQRGREKILSRLHPQNGARCRAWSQNPKVMTWAKVKSTMLYRLSHPGAPPWNLFLTWLSGRIKLNKYVRHDLAYTVSSFTWMVSWMKCYTSLRYSSYLNLNLTDILCNLLLSCYITVLITFIVSFICHLIKVKQSLCLHTSAFRISKLALFFFLPVSFKLDHVIFIFGDGYMPI